MKISSIAHMFYNFKRLNDILAIDQLVCKTGSASVVPRHDVFFCNTNATLKCNGFIFRKLKDKVLI